MSDTGPLGLWFVFALSCSDTNDEQVDFMILYHSGVNYFIINMSCAFYNI